jgi:hypothetical protein
MRTLVSILALARGRLAFAAPKPGLPPGGREAYTFDTGSCKAACAPRARPSVCAPGAHADRDHLEGHAAAS